MAKNAIKKLKKHTKNHNETPEIYSNWIQLVNAKLRSNPNACYVAKMCQKESKKVKNSPKLPKKRVILFVEFPPLENVCFTFSPVHLVTLSKRFVLGPNTLIWESDFMEI